MHLPEWGLEAGAPFIQEIRKEMADCRQVLCLISPHYLRSKFCLAEMGAAWFQQDKLLPILIPPARYQDLEDTPAEGLQTLQQNNKDDLWALYDQLCACGIAQTGRTAQFSRQLAQYMDWLRSRQRSGSSRSKRLLLRPGGADPKHTAQLSLL